MSVVRIAGRYAKSLLDLALEQGSMAEVVSDVESFVKMVDHRELYLLLKSPIVNVGKKQQIFDALFEGKVNKLTKAFFDIILRKGREAYLPEIAQEFLVQYKKMQGISTVHLTTAAPLSDETIEKIKRKLLDSNATAKSLEIESVVDENILGGFVIKIGDKLLDASVAHKLAGLAKEMTDRNFEVSI